MKVSRFKKILATVLVAVTLVSGNIPCLENFIVLADESATVVCSDGAWVAARSGPGTNYSIDHRLANGKPLTVIEETKGTDGKTWYKVKYNLDINNQECTSYIRSDFVSKSSNSSAADTSGNDASTSSSTTATSTTGTYATGTITGSNVKVRSAAGTSNSVVTSLYNGHTVDIIGQTSVNGVVWYNVTGTNGGTSFTGWTISTYLKVSYTQATDTDYAASLKAAGFTDGYVANLTALHQKYPSWTFEAINTGLDWNAVIENESKNGKNLVSKSLDDSKKSTASGAYEWTTNTWTQYETGWVAASSEYIAYCMDPRNFLDETNIFQFLSMAYNASETLSGVQSIVKGTFMEGTKTYKNNGETINYAQTFLDVAKATGVSAYHLASRVKQEQGTKGTSSLISGTYSGYEGYYNFFNFNAYGSTSAQIYQRGLSYAKTKGWNSRYNSIKGGAEKIASDYVGKGQNTIYFEKFNVVNHNSLYSHQYMANVSAAISEGQSTAKGYSDKNQSFVFKIPIYNNMPSSACQVTTTGNPNNYLKSLSISGVSLTPSFSGATTNYSVVVSNAVSSVSVSAASVASKSTVTGTGTYQLSVGSNTIKVNCKSQSGSTRTYTITISRQAASDTGNKTDNTGGNTGNITDNTGNNTGTNTGDTTQYTLSSSSYTIGDYISGIQPQTSASTFLSQFATNGKIKLVTSTGAENSGAVGTGNKVELYDSTGTVIQKTYEIVVYGDVSEDGKISIKDMMLVNRHILGKSTLSGAKAKAADVSRDGRISIKDMMLMNNNILGKSTIQQ